MRVHRPERVRCCGRATRRWTSREDVTRVWWLPPSSRRTHPARFLTSDATPGEADVARALIEAAPGDLDHEVSRTEAGSATPSTELLERARNLHLLHDGVRHPQKLRGKMTLPRPRPRNATFSGHGGEIAHGFFYKNERQLKKVSRRKKRIPDRVMRFFEKDHGAARPEAYEVALAVVEENFDAGREAGLDGPVLLDWFYLTERFAHRSGLATDSERDLRLRNARFRAERPSRSNPRIALPTACIST